LLLAAASRRLLEAAMHDERSMIDTRLARVLSAWPDGRPMTLSI